VKEEYLFLDATPTYSYARMLYRYPQSPYPYARLVQESARRGLQDPEFELADTGIFDENRYFDVVLEYAKAAPEEILIRITTHNAGPEAAALDLLPQLWFRNTWSWGGHMEKPNLDQWGPRTMIAEHTQLGRMFLYCDADPELLFTENETNPGRHGGPAAAGPFKDAFHEYVVEGRGNAISPHGRGTKAAARYRLSVDAGASVAVRLRLGRTETDAPFEGFAESVGARLSEVNAFYESLAGAADDPQRRDIQRQAWAGLLWSKQYYHYDVARWLRGDPTRPPPPAGRARGRNRGWEHLNNADIISMPDTWEYPWYAAWDLAFHCVALAELDPEFAKKQLLLLTREWYMHPSGQLPAYEWSLGDVNPPVHAWGTWRVYEIDRDRHGGRGDTVFLERVFQKLLLNFTWWVNRKDSDDLNVFQGGFLGLDNIGVFDRSEEIPGDGHLDQADGTAWMAMYSLNLLRIALELARTNPIYQDMATKFFEHFLYIAAALNDLGGAGIEFWDSEDEFFYDVLHKPDGAVSLRVRSLVGLVPLFAVEILEPGHLAALPEFRKRLEWFEAHRPDLAGLVSRWQERGQGQRRLLSLVRAHRMKCVLRRALDETEFLSDFGVRSLSRYHLDHPYRIQMGDGEHVVRYRAAESDSRMFGGNSNWRGPIWFPVNHLLIESLHKFHAYYGDDFRVECPTGSGTLLTLEEVADELCRRLARLCRADPGGRPAAGDHVLFHEYFDGDTGAGLGASHQTGWTALVAGMLGPRGETSS